ncbi:hypothetical protein V6N12_035641 [Hibiscus sabdariffa]|uniref:Uncharacterized protein n=1 Tax=Hibiscus sabdariffa TaxID=183260 RepID=A0ABR2ENQ9_9ROSI
MAEQLKRPTHNWRIVSSIPTGCTPMGTSNKSIGIASVSMECHHLYITNWCGSTRTKIKHWVELFFGVKVGRAGHWDEGLSLGRVKIKGQCPSPGLRAMLSLELFSGLFDPDWCVDLGGVETSSSSF